MAYLEGVYWDLDGTIANTELEAHLPAFNKSFNDLGLSWYWDKLTYINLLKINGGKNRIAYYAASIKESIDYEFILKIHKKKQEIYLDLIEEGSVTLKEGVKRLVNQLTNNNVRQFIVTSSSKIQVESLISKLFEDRDPFEFFVSSEDVTSLKPDPSPYLKAINLSGINIENSIALEDSYAGLISSKAANLSSIIIQSNIPVHFNKEDLTSSCLISSLGDGNFFSKVLIGPDSKNGYIDFDFINNFLNT